MPLQDTARIPLYTKSGTTALVADRLGRDAVGIELSPKYAEMARRKVAGDVPATEQLPLVGAS